ncbi:MAG: bL32 family ribosomal protein [Acidobacteriota bacterium]
MRKPALTLSALGIAFALASSAFAQNDDAAAAAGCGLCGSFFLLIFVAILALNIAILVWVARDAKARGLDNGILWMLLVLFTGIVGLIVYLLARPQGNLVVCPNCGNKRLQAAVKCPSCGA